MPTFESIVDRLLASPQFGERWGRHWLDVARYGESAGSSRDVLMLYAWRYRDYVIDAFNQDMPLDRFIREQVAGDLLPASSESDRHRQMIATGFLAIGSKSLNGGNLTYDVIDDQIDVISKSVLGLTVSCARCHDHKFDPIPTRDYYSLAGFFLSTETRYGGGTKRPKNATEKAQQYLVLGRSTDRQKQAKVRDEAAQKFEQLDKQIASSQKRVKALAGGCAQGVPRRSREGDSRIDRCSDGEIDSPVPGCLSTAATTLAEREEAKALLGPEPEYALGVQDAEKIMDAKVLDSRGKESAWGTGRTRLSDGAGRFGSARLKSMMRQAVALELAAWLVHSGQPFDVARCRESNLAAPDGKWTGIHGRQFWRHRVYRRRIPSYSIFSPISLSTLTTGRPNS